MQVSGFICDSNSKVSITNENSVSRTSSFGASVGDPYGIVSASVSFSTEETASQSYTYEFTPDKSKLFVPCSVRCTLTLDVHL